MPRLRFRLPIEFEVTDEELDAVEAVGNVVTKAREAGLPQALSEVIKKTAAAARSVRRRVR